MVYRFRKESRTKKNGKTRTNEVKKWDQGSLH